MADDANWWANDVPVKLPAPPQPSAEEKWWANDPPAPSGRPSRAALPQAKAEELPPEEPGFFSTVGQSAIRGAVESGTSALQAPTAFRDRAPPQPAPQDAVSRLLATSLAQGWTSPTWWAAHFAHGAAASVPALALGAAGAMAGEAVAPEGGGIPGGAAGFALGSMIQEIAPAYQQARTAGLDHDAAVTRAIEQTGIAGAFGTVMGLAPGVAAFGRTAENALRRPISEALLQIFGVQPGLGSAQQVTQGAVEGKLPTAGEVATGYAENVGLGTVLTAGHGAVRALRGTPAAPGEAAGPAQFLDPQHRQALDEALRWNPEAEEAPSEPAAAAAQQPPPAAAPVEAVQPPAAQPAPTPRRAAPAAATPAPAAATEPPLPPLPTQPRGIRSIDQIAREDGVSPRAAAQVQLTEIAALGRPITNEEREARIAGVQAMPRAEAPTEAAPAATAGKPDPGTSLLQFLIQRGGLQPHGDLRAMDANIARPGLVRKSTGMQLDYAREAAAEAGFLPMDSAPADLLDLIGRELKGQKQFGNHMPEQIVPGADVTGREEARREAVTEDVRMAADDAGLNISGATLDHAVELAARGMAPEQAVSEAARFAVSGPNIEDIPFGRRAPAEKIDWTPGGGSKTVRLGNSIVEYGVGSDGKTGEVILVRTPRDQRGQGSGRAAMEALLAEADRRGTTMFLNADPMDRGISKPKLEQFYKSLGFVKNMGKAKDFRSRAEFVRQPLELPQFGRRAPLPPQSGAPLLGEPERAPRETPQREPTIRNDTRQLGLLGTEPSAVQAQAARDQAGRGALLPKGEQKAADEGLFAKKNTQEPLFGRRDEAARTPLHSALQRGVESLKLDRAPAGQWLSTIRNMPGVKAEEVRWSGVEDWLKQQPKPVTRAEVADYLRANSLDVREVGYGQERDQVVPDAQAGADHGAEWEQFNEKIQPLQEALRQTRDPAEQGRIMEALDHWTMQRGALHDKMVDETMRRQGISGKPTKFSQYQLPGGRGYRELLITLPPKAPMLEPLRELPEGYEYSTDSSQPPGRRWSVIPPGQIHGRPYADMHASREAAGDAALRQLNAERQSRAESEAHANVYRGSHWDEPNVLAHVRFSERDGADGKRTLLVEEVQSDWHQKGRKEGYDVPNMGPEYAIYSKGSRVADGLTKEQAEARAAELNARGQTTMFKVDETGYPLRGAVPDAPFKTTWPALVMKRVIKYAVDNGFDRIAWAPGEVQAARYDLSKHIDELHWNAGNLVARDHAGKEVIRRTGMRAEELPDVIGKEATDKLLKQEPDNGGWRSLEGADLKVGGEGMRAFYDKMLPAEVNKIAGKFGAKVGESRLQERDQTIANNSTAHAAALGVMPVHSLDINPAMKRAVATEGLPLFQRQQAAARGEIPHPEAIRAAIDAARRITGNRVRIETYDADHDVFRVRFPDGKTEQVFGYTLGRLIRAAIEPGRTGWNLNHEAVHALKALGVFSPGEWRTLQSAARKGGWVEAEGIAKRYPGLTDAQHIEEAIAERFARWTTEPKAATPLIARLGQKVAAFFQRVRNALAGRGFQTPEDVFGRMERGEVGAREPAPGAPTLPESEDAARRFEAAQGRAGPPPEPVFARGPRQQGQLPLAPQEQSAFRRELRNIGDRVLRAFSPTSRGPGAGAAELVIRSETAAQAADRQRTIAALDDVRRVIDRVPVEERLRLWGEGERGQHIADPTLREANDAIQRTLDQWTAKIQHLGRVIGRPLLADAIENYRGRAYGNFDDWISGRIPGTPPAEAMARATAAGLSKPIRGSGNFLKQRSFEHLSDAMEAGLQPVTTNPVEMQMLKVFEMQRFLHGTMMAERLKRANIGVQWVPYHEEGAARREGLVKLDDPYFQPMVRSEAEYGARTVGNWYAPEPVARVFNNYVSRGLYEKGSIYNMAREAGNALNMAQLGLSGFHATFVTLDALTSNMALGLQQVSRGELGRGIKTLAESTPIGAPWTIYRTVRGGAEMRRWMRADYDTLPEPAKKLVDSVLAGGGRDAMDAFYSADQSGAFANNMKDVARIISHPGDLAHDIGQMFRETPFKAPLRLYQRLMQQTMVPLMQHLVPMMKLGVMRNLAADWLRRNPNASEAERAEAMTKAWDSVDNRLGQLVYDNVFWNKTQKDLAFLAVRSVGWNLGTVRELGGAFVDVARQLGRLERPELTTRMAYAIAMPVQVAMLGALVTYLTTGRGPQKGPDEATEFGVPLDYWYPPDGAGGRLSIPSYMKDVVAYSKAPVGTILNKLHPLASAVQQLYQNKDYYGGAIYAPDYGDNPFEAYGKFMLGQALPFSVRGQMRARATNVSPLGSALSFFGIQPAPASIEHPERAEKFRLMDERKGFRQRAKEQARGITP